MSKQDTAPETPGTEIATTEEAELQLAEQFKATLGIDGSDLIVPLLKVAQGNTKEVEEGEAERGDLLNSLTGENFGSSTDIIIAAFYKGRFRVDRDTGEVICAGPSVDPKGRPLTCGCHELPYPECPDAEEKYKEAANKGDIEWGKGPPVATTYNFLAIVVGAESGMPVKLSLMRDATKDAKKLLTMLNFRKAPWDTVFTLTTTKKQGGGYTWHGVNVKQGRRVTAEERQAAVDLAVASQQGRVQEVGDQDSTDADGAEAEDAKASSGGLDY